MTPTLARAAKSLRDVAHLNLTQAKQAKRDNRLKLAAFHAEVALSCRRDANQLLKHRKP